MAAVRRLMAIDRARNGRRSRPGAIPAALMTMSSESPFSLFSA
jgi:hypothetical protein